MRFSSVGQPWKVARRELSLLCILSAISGIIIAGSAYPVTAMAVGGWPVPDRGTPALEPTPALERFIPITPDQVSEVINRVMPDAAYWIVPEGFNVLAGSPESLFRVDDRSFTAATTDAPMVDGVWWNLSDEPVTLWVDDQTDPLTIDPLDMVAVGVQDNGTLYVIGVECDSNHYACCTKKPARAFCVPLGRTETCDTGGPGASACSITAPDGGRVRRIMASPNDDPFEEHPD